MSKKLYIPYTAACLFGVLFLFMFPEAVKESIKNSLERCSTQLLPSFFPMMILARQIYQSLSISSGAFSDLCCRISGFPKKLFPIFLTGILCGYPAPAIICKKGLEDGTLTKKEAEICTILCNNASPSFVIILIGNGVFESIPLGISLFILQTACVICAAHIFLRKEKTTIPTISQGKENISETVLKCTYSMLEICGFVVFFSLIADALNMLFLQVHALSLFRIFISGMTEITGGVNSVRQLKNSIKIPFLCAFISTGGLSVFFQIFTFVKFKLSSYFAVRLTIFSLLVLSFSVLFKIFGILSLL
ncbi:MAG: hypothetical protein E7621_02675 [Ruminococcaceae bacterium]|nr:hypothetical protein [Oscillospiraceae bacterium]